MAYLFRSLFKKLVKDELLAAKSHWDGGDRERSSSQRRYRQVGAAAADAVKDAMGASIAFPTRYQLLI